MKKKIWVVMAIVLLLTAVLTGTSFAATKANISATGPASASPGETIAITVRLSAGVDVDGFNFDLVFDSERLEYVSFSAGMDGVEANSTGTGSISVIGFNMSSGVYIPANSTQTLGTFSFRVKDSASGSAQINIQNVTIEDSSTMEPIPDAEISASGTSVTIIPAVVPSSDATLKSLTISQETMDIVSGLQFSPAFQSDVTEYSMWVPYRLSEVKFDAVPTDPAASVSVSGTGVAPGTATEIVITVTAPDGVTTKDYRIRVTRSAASSDSTLSSLVPSAGTLSPSFSSNVTSYRLTLPSNVSSVSFTAKKSDYRASVQIPSSVTVNSGETVSVNIIVTAENGTTKTTYNVRITREEGSSSTETPEPPAPSSSPDVTPPASEDPSATPDETVSPAETERPLHPTTQPTSSGTPSQSPSQTTAPINNRNWSKTVVWIVVIAGVLLLLAVGFLIWNGISNKCNHDDDHGGDDPDDHTPTPPEEDDGGSEDSGEPKPEEPKRNSPYRTR